MPNDWILDVLADLRSFAASNGMDRLADHIDHTALVAAAEIGAVRAPGPGMGPLARSARPHRAVLGPDA